MAEGYSVTLTELDTLYNFHGLAELHALLDIKLTKNQLDSAKIDLNTPKS